MNQDSSRWGKWFDGLLIAFILFGIGLRFSGLEWNQGTNLHPDEYGLTNTLTQLKLPASFDDYFNTRISPLSPYMRYDAVGIRLSDGPDNRMRWGQWPLIILRVAAEWSGKTGYDELRIMGRYLSAGADSLSIFFLFLIGKRLFGSRIGLLAAALSALAVLQIQQAHFMTVDTFAVLFSTVAMYAAVGIAQARLALQTAQGTFRANYREMGWFVLFGIAFGMAVASKVNLAPLAGMVVIAVMISIADLRLTGVVGLRRILFTGLVFLMLSGFVSVLVFRLTQPMSFRASMGNTTLLTLQPNSDWLESMQVAQGESSGVGGGPPGEQWTARIPLVFPWLNQVLWGMGLPLGLTAWFSFGWALWQWLSTRGGWRAQLVVLVWTGGYFLFMGTRWVMSVRYFLPIYPFLCLLAAWGTLGLWQKLYDKKLQLQKNGALRSVRWVLPGLANLVVGGVLVGTCIWAVVFMQAVYWTDHTRLQATEWIFQNIPAPFHLSLHTVDGREVFVPVGGPSSLKLVGNQSFSQSFQVSDAGTIAAIVLPHVTTAGSSSRIHLSILSEGPAALVMGETELSVPVSIGGKAAEAVQGEFKSLSLLPGRTYTLMVRVPAGSSDIQMSRSVIANESWDEGLPVPFEGLDPFGQLYRGLTLQVRWLDDANKRQMFVDTLSQADYIVVPSQRAVWATCRLPQMYPMTMAYYQALFGEQLGFKQVASFSAPLRLGPLYISDLAGSMAWGRAPELPVFNHNLFAAEEAFSVYDHPPVWIFKKQSGFDTAQVQQVLSSVDLSQVQNQSPRDATGSPCQ